VAYQPFRIPDGAVERRNNGVDIWDGFVMHQKSAEAVLALPNFAHLFIA